MLDWLTVFSVVQIIYVELLVCSLLDQINSVRTLILAEVIVLFDDAAFSNLFGLLNLRSPAAFVVRLRISIKVANVVKDAHQRLQTLHVIQFHFKCLLVQAKDSLFKPICIVCE